MKKTLFILSSTALLGTMALSPLTSTAFAQTHYNMKNTVIIADGKVTSMQLGFTFEGTTYMPIYYVMQTLKSSLNITSTWTGSIWNLQVPASPQADLTDIQVGSGKTGIYINGTLVQRVNTLTAVDPASKVTTTYMPIWYVMRILERLHVVNTWDGQDWSMYTGIPQNELKAYETKHPGENIGYIKPVFFTSGAESLVVENTPVSSDETVTISVVSPDLSVTDFKTTADSPDIIKDIPQANGDLAAAFEITGAHTSLAYLLKSVNGKPEVVQEYTGDNGVGVWLQDGKPQVIVSNRTYNWDLVAPGGQKDDSAVNDVYQYTNGSFEKIAEYKSGVFENEPQLPSNPQVTAESMMEYLLMSSNDEHAAIDNLKTTSFASENYTAQFVSDLESASSTLESLKTVPATAVISLNTVDQTDSTVDYSCQIGGHQYFLTLVNNNQSWTLNGFRTVTISGEPVSP